MVDKGPDPVQGNEFGQLFGSNSCKRMNFVIQRFHGSSQKFLRQRYVCAGEVTILSVQFEDKTQRRVA